MKEEEKLTEILDLTQDLSSEDNSPPLKSADLEEFIKQRKRQCNSKRERQNLKIESSTTSRPPACASKYESKTPGPLLALQNTPSVEWTPLRSNIEEEQEQRLQELREKLTAGDQRDELSDPWWMRFPDFVPAVLLKPMPSAGSGLDPRYLSKANLFDYCISGLVNRFLWIMSISSHELRRLQGVPKLQ